MNERPDLAAGLGHRFSRKALLEAALTHSSFGTPNNERLEFLGDGLLNFVVADLLFERFPELDEGELTRLRASLVRQDSLHRIATALGLGEHLKLGDGEVRSGGRQRPSILADGVEALIGAVYLDAGFDRAREVIRRLYAEQVEAIDPRQARASLKDPKTRLQEYLQARRQPLPLYVVRATQGEAHAQIFEVACELAALGITTTGSGSSRRAAEQQAAEAALTVLSPQ